MIEMISSELLGLYQNSGSEFFEEALAVIKSYMPDLSHSFFGIGKRGTYEVLVSDIKDVDEIRFLEKAIFKELPSEDLKGCYQLSLKRRSVMGHVVIPLLVKKVICGVWVLESVTTPEISMREVYYKIANLMALFIQNGRLEKASVQNFYLEAKTQLPGKEYFLKVISELKRKKHNLYLGVFRMMSYREDIRMYGSSYMEKTFLNLLHTMQELKIGKLYVLSEDTVALLMNESEQESFAGVKEVMNCVKGKASVAVAFLQLEREENLLTLLEEIFSVTPSGTVWRREVNPIASLFVGAVKTENEKQKSTSFDTELVEELILELTEGT